MSATLDNPRNKPALFNTAKIKELVSELYVQGLVVQIRGQGLLDAPDQDRPWSGKRLILLPPHHSTSARITSSDKFNADQTASIYVLGNINGRTVEVIPPDGKIFDLRPSSVVDVVGHIVLYPDGPSKFKAGLHSRPTSNPPYIIKCWLGANHFAAGVESFMRLSEDRSRWI